MLTEQINENEERVFEALQSQWPFPIDRTHLVQLSALARTTVYDAIKRLERKGRVVTFPFHTPKKRGRPSTFYFSVQLHPEELAQVWPRVEAAREPIQEETGTVEI